MEAGVGTTISRRDAKRAVDTLERKLEYTREKVKNWTGSRKSLPYLLAEAKAYAIAIATLRECYDLERPGDIEREEERWGE